MGLVRCTLLELCPCQSVSQSINQSMNNSFIFFVFFLLTDLCDKGQSSLDGFNDLNQHTCNFCYVGFYQYQYGATDCKQCPSGLTTLKKRSTSLADCGSKFENKAKNGVCNGKLCARFSLIENDTPIADKDWYTSWSWRIICSCSHGVFITFINAPNN